MLSILFMRFQLKLCVFDQPMDWSFNSLYEIHCDLSWRFKDYFNFQFSLWDSQHKPLLKQPLKLFQFSLWDSQTQDLDELVSFIDFQFSLWDSSHNRCSNLWISLLSILFMRFLEAEAFVFLSVIAFNSLYEILLLLQILHPATSLTFNSLYEILSKMLLLLVEKFRKTFNSLYEIQPYTREANLLLNFTFNSLYEILFTCIISLYYFIDFQFSLWDSKLTR